MDKREGNTGEDIFLVAELPKSEDYKISGKSVDIGIVYNVEGVTNYNKRWCFFNGKHYWTTDRAKLDETAKKAGITLPSTMDLPYKKAGITVENKWLRSLLNSSELYEMIFPITALIVIAIIGFIKKRRPKLKALKPFNNTLNEQNAAKLVFRYHYKIKTYNGSDVKWSAFNAGTISILLPPGDCSIVFSSKYEYEPKKYINTHNHSANGVLKAGKTYCIKTYLNNIDPKNIELTHLVEINDNELKTYVKKSAWADYSTETTLIMASRHITRVAENITLETAQQFVNDFMQQMQDKGYHFVDERSGNAATLYIDEFEKFPIAMLPGEVYTYIRDNWLLLISRGELGIMLSFSNSK